MSTVEFDYNDRALKVFQTFPDAKPNGRGSYDVPDEDSDIGTTFTVDEDGLFMGSVGFMAKHNERVNSTRTAAAAAVDASDVATRRAVRRDPANKTLERRANDLNAKQVLDFSDIKYDATKAEIEAAKKMGGTIPTLPMNTETNLYRLFDALFVGGKIDEVHYDTSRRMLIDEDGELVDDAWPARPLMDAARAVKLKGLSSDKLVKALRVWALDYKFNDITERVKARLTNVERDGTERLETFLIDTLQCADTPANRLFSKYWCLSLYNRVMNPGCRAPIAMAVFGGMDAGKSYFQKIICEELLFSNDAAPVEYDPAREPKDLFRDIYGISIIASIPEMTNFGRIDLRKMKAFMTGTTDTFDQKFGFSGPWPRQWIVVMDGNRYEGLWRDDDDVDANGESQGERRFFPIFAFEIPGSTGSIRWRVEKDLKLPYLNDGGVQFREDFWQVMKECETFMTDHGEEAYDDLVSKTSRMVRDFSKREKDAGQGTVRDKTFDEHFPSVLYRCITNRGQIGVVNVAGEKVRGLRVMTKDIQSAYFDMTHKEITPQKVSSRMKSLACKKGFAGRDAMKVTTFVFDQPEFAALADGREDVEKMRAAFVKLFVSDDPVDDVDAKTEDEVRRDEGF